MTTKKLKLAVFTATFVLGGFAGIASAKGGHGPDRQAIKQRFDLDKDGTLNAAEKARFKQAFAEKRAQRQAKQLAEFDTNRDGKIEGPERSAMQQARSAKRFARLDVNGDGALTLREFQAGSGSKARRHHRGVRRP